MNTVERIGHRGAPREFVENTMPSFRRAVELGADAVELDIHSSADGEPFVHHDPTLPRSVTPKAAAGKAISAMSAADLRAVRLASGDPLPVLRELLDELAGRVFIYVELKGGAPEEVASVLKPHSGSVAVHSFDHDAIAKMAVVAPEIPRGVLFDAGERDLAGLLRRTGATDVWPAARLVDADLVAAVGAAGGRIITWTVNKASDAERLVGLGVAGICTDDLTIFRPR